MFSRCSWILDSEQLLLENFRIVRASGSESALVYRHQEYTNTLIRFYPFSFAMRSKVIHECDTLEDVAHATFKCSFKFQVMERTFTFL